MAVVVCFEGVGAVGGGDVTPIVIGVVFVVIDWWKWW